MRRRVICLSFAVVVCVTIMPASLLAQGQTGGTISGTVRDSTGAVLPGVTVEASSPALIEKVRTVVSDSNGLYRIVDLSPGVYSVTFTLVGFSTFRREGIEVAAAVTAAVNAELRIGSLAETIVVSGQSPLVDVQSATEHRVISTELIEDLPTGKTPSNYAVLVPDRAGARTRLDHFRVEPHVPKHSAGRTAARRGTHSPLDGRFAWPLGR